MYSIYRVLELQSDVPDTHHLHLNAAMESVMADAEKERERKNDLDRHLDKLDLKIGLLVEHQTTTAAIARSRKATKTPPTLTKRKSEPNLTMLKNILTIIHLLHLRFL